jgi:hypothetical protein
MRAAPVFTPSPEALQADCAPARRPWPQHAASVITACAVRAAMRLHTGGTPCAQADLGRPAVALL